MKVFLVQWKGSATTDAPETDEATTGWTECRCPAWSMTAQ